jgi:two-component system CheB/CheR fusion protein
LECASRQRWCGCRGRRLNAERCGHPGGLLFLGRSETANHPAGCFEQLDKQSKLYARVRSATGLQPPQMRIRREAQREAAWASRDREESQGADAFHAMIDAVAPNSVLVDDESRIRQVFGSAGDYLRLPPGEAPTATAKLVPAGTSTELNTLLHRARKHRRALRGQRHELTLARKGRVLLQLQVIPINVGGRRDFLIGFEQFEVSERQPAAPELAAASKASSAEERIKQLEMELKATRESLQLTVEEHETANEELTTLNQELHVKSGELQLVNQRLSAI